MSLKISKSEGRLFKEKSFDIRSPFQRDRDRIIHSASFRRLKHKTQVFVNTNGDHFRTRLTHSMEVAQIARTIARTLNLNEDLCEALSLAHDMGHTPFGHAGEDVLDDCMKPFGGFDHNIQTLRIVTVLEEKYYYFKGLNLTIETLDGLVKHVVQKGLLRASTSPDPADVYLIAVPTPFKGDHEPDLKYVESATRMILPN